MTQILINNQAPTSPFLQEKDTSSVLRCLVSAHVTYSLVRVLGCARRRVLYRYFTSSCTVSQCRCFASHKCHLTSFSLDTSCIPKKGHPPPLTCLTAFSLFAARLAKLATGVCKPRSSTVSMVPAYQPRSSAACRRATPGLAQEFPCTNTGTAPLRKHALLVEKETSSVEPVVLQGRGVTAKSVEPI